MPKNMSSDSILSTQNTNSSNSPKEKVEEIFTLLASPVNESLYQTIISNISSSLFNLIYINKKNHRQNHNHSDIFSAKKIPNLTIEDFLMRVVKYSKLEISSLLSLYIYIMKLLKINPEIVLSYCNAYRIILGACVLSVKFHEDYKFPFLYYAKIGGMTVQELTEVEYSFYTRIHFELFVTEEEVKDTLSLLLQ